MAQQLLLKVICNHQGTLNYADLADIGCGADMICALDKLVENDLCSIAVCNGNERIFAKTKVRRCKAQQCDGCNDLHLCKLYLFGDCKNSIGRRTCRFGHDLHSEHNSIVLREHKLETLSRQELRQLLLQNDNSLLPPVCNSYNKGTRPYGNCPDQEGCRRLHVCDRYIRGTCSSGADCNRCHDFFEPHPLRTLQQRGVPNDLMASMLSTYQNIQAMKSEGAGGAASINRPQSCPQRNTVRNEICLFFVKEDCKQGEKCSRVHFKMPYKWEVNSGQTWSALPENETIERDFCDPSKIHSEGAERVRFDSMSRGLWDVRRLSTVSSVTKPTYVLTTEWVWFWEDEYGKWIQYASIKEMHRLSSITSEDLEKRFQEDQSAVVKFTAGQQSYELSFRDMTQFNERFGTIRMVRRRPVFVSTVDAQAARSRRNGARNPSQNFRAVPGSWDKSAIPDIGYKTVTLLSSDRDYQKVQRLFNNTMRGFQITSIERVQNRDLWEVFQWKRDLMKKNNGGKNSKELHLFHGTDPKHVDAICRDNFDWRLCGTNGTTYGEGSYFARDAKYSHCFTSHSGVRSMFVCQVLVGDYTRGNSALRRPPPKGEGSPTLYDSCVDNVLNPSIYVVFEKHQVYPEFLIRYDDGVMHWSTSAPAPLKTVSIQSTSLTPKSNRIQATAPATTPARTPSRTLTTPASTPSHTLTSPASTPSRTLTTPASSPSCTLTTPASTPFHTLTTPASTPSHTLTTPASTPSRTLTTPASTPSHTLTTPASTPSRTLTTPASTPSHTLTTPANTPSRTLTAPASTPSRKLTTPASTPSRTLTTPASTPSRALTTPASTPSYTFTTPASTPSYTFTTPASTPSYTFTTPASTPSYTFTTPASTPSYTFTTPASTPSYTFTTPASTPSPTLTTPASTASRRLAPPASTTSRRLALQPPTPSPTLTLSASTLSPALSPLTGPLSLAHTRSTTTTHTLPASSTSHSLSPSSSLSTPYHTLSHSSYSPTYTQTLSHTSPSTSSNSPSTLSPSASNLSRVFSPSTGAFYRPLSTTTSTTRSPPESLYSVPTAQRRDSKEKNKCLLQ
ncbi:protein mono-ADP-ribosyltransferase PARP12 isoform X2 [Oncorhynchus mykiss]|uniref:protein mono-ADP-ribosyltransferase PARP12 isoform X1 n=2 Tax=Oncorhynchus mykiss TaxID=8022 RepID=UPI001877D284|nr:protein mono-ADP-ribosyltransferase PARP12 isoform X1 [Oncorhynchus mykiss]XP_036800719.1 protein mono-ADP-ribosyltransferase PARP12 isoform X2 [Oncorhynchus mykiss]